MLTVMVIGRIVENQFLPSETERQQRRQQIKQIKQKIQNKHIDEVIDSELPVYDVLSTK
jgi:hypothetical protein